MAAAMLAIGPRRSPRFITRLIALEYSIRNCRGMKPV